MMKTKILRVLLSAVIGFMLIWAAAPANVSASTVPPEDTDYIMIDDYWPMENTGPGELIYASGPLNYGHGPASGASGPYTTVIDPHGDMSWGSEVDRKYAQFWNPIYGVWDLGSPFSEVVVLPQQDHGPYPAEALEYKIWGSNDFNASNPGAATWIAADLDTVYRKGWSDVGEGIYPTCNDDYVSVWDWKPGPGAGDSYRFVKLQSVWASPYNEPEIDAVKGVVGLPTPEEVGWRKTVVERGRVFSYTSLVISYDGKVHLAYGGEQLYYAVWDGYTWQRQEIEDGGVGAYCSLALDSTGKPAISYYDATNADLKYARWNGTSWDIGTVDSAGNVGQYTSLAFDSSGNPAISYHDATKDDLKYAHWNGTSWIGADDSSLVPDTVDSAGWVGSYTSLAFDGSGNPAISYYDATNGDLKYAYWRCCQWYTETVDSAGDVGSYTSLALDRSGNPAISYHDATKGDLKYAQRKGITWDVETVDSAGWVGSYTSLALDSSGNPAISYYDATKGDLKYARWNGTSWEKKTVDSGGDVGWYTSLAFDRSGNPAVSYYDATNDYLKYAHWNGTSWDIETLDSVSDVGSYTSLAFDSSDNPAISYYDLRHSDLKYAHWDGTDWDIETVDSSGDVGRYTSLAFDSTGNPAISYYDITNGNLKYAYWKGATWYRETVDSLGDVGSYTSLAFDSSGNPAISYYDATNDDLKYAHWDGVGWDTERVDSAGDVGSYTSLAFDSTGNPAISYYDATYSALKYARKSGAGWYIEKIDSPGDVGSYTSLAFDSSGNPAISYHDATKGDLKYAHWDGTGWDIEAVDSADWVGLYTSLAFSSSGNPAISYHDATKGDLKYARWNGKSWDIEIVDSAGWAGRYTSLAFDSSGGTAISYHEATHNDLKYAYFPNRAPNQPRNTSPVSGATDVSPTPTLKSSPFSDPDGDLHAASQWQATATAGDYSSPVFDSGTDSSNLTQITLPSETLSHYTTYYWRVRHQDHHGTWSPYSLETSFTTHSRPDQPVNVSPADGAAHVSLTPTLESSAFSDPDEGVTHTASQWQVTTTPGDYSSPVFDSGTDSSNLTQIAIPTGELSYNTTYYWRVSHQDHHGAWSSYSLETSFTTYTPPNQPVNTSPVDGATDVSTTFTLQSSAFADPDEGTTHTASQWQVTTTAGDYSNPVYDSGRDSSHLTQIAIASKNHNTTYYWRARHQNSYGAWSGWSAETSFATAASSGLFSSSLIWIFLVVILLVVGAAIVGWWFLSKSSRKKTAQKAQNRPKSPYH